MCTDAFHPQQWQGTKYFVHKIKSRTRQYVKIFQTLPHRVNEVLEKNPKNPVKKIISIPKTTMDQDTTVSLVGIFFGILLYASFIVALWPYARRRFPCWLLILFILFPVGSWWLAFFLFLPVEREQPVIIVVEPAQRGAIRTYERSSERNRR